MAGEQSSVAAATNRGLDQMIKGALLSESEVQLLIKKPLLISFRDEKGNRVINQFLLLSGKKNADLRVLPPPSEELRPGLEKEIRERIAQIKKTRKNKK